MKHALLFWLTMAVTGALVTFGSVSSALAQASADSDEYAVYTSVLGLFIGRDTRQLVIKKHTPTDFGAPSNLIDLLSPLMSETIKDFDIRSKQSVELKDHFNLDVKINLVGDEIKEIFAEGRKSTSKKDGWALFHDKYPTAGEIITLSRVGFNKDKTQALIYVGYDCGSLCGEGDFILLLKEDGAWAIKEKSILWIS